MKVVKKIQSILKTIWVYSTENLSILKYSKNNIILWHVDAQQNKKVA